MFSTSTNFDASLNIWSGGDAAFQLNRELGFGHFMLNELRKSPADYVIQINHNTGRKVTCSEMKLKATKFAEILNTSMNIRCGDNITIISAHQDDLVSVVIGASAAGAVINPLDPSFSINEIVHFMRMTRPKVVICDENSVDRMLECQMIIGDQSKILILGKPRNGIESIENLLIGFEATTFVPENISDLNRNALLMCSSGTTGFPKLVIITHLMATNGFRMWWSVRSDEIYFSPSNMYWLTSPGTIFHSILHRCPRIIVESNAPVTAKVILDILLQHKVNVTFLSPAIVMEMLKLLRESCDTIKMESIRILACGGSFVSDKLVQSMSSFIPNGKMFSCYGMTEVSGLISTCEFMHRKDTVGQLAPDLEASVVDEEGCRCQPDECGEICLRYKKFEIKLIWPMGLDVTQPLFHLFDLLYVWDSLQGYLNDEPENRKAFDAEKWFRTGDIGFFDRDGFLHLIDRKKEMLKYCNYQISPTELEMCIEKHFAVDGVCVVGIDNEKCGQLPAAVVVLKKNGDSVTKEAIINLIKDYFSDSKQLRGGVFFVSSLPMTSSGKIQRKLVKQMISIGSKN